MENSFTDGVIKLLATLVLLGDILIILFGLTILLHDRIAVLDRLKRFIAENGIVLALLFATIATIGSLFLSEVAGFTPCKLCWWQRIFMYPQVVVFGLGTYLNDKKVKYYGIVLSLVGAGVSIYHYLVQMFPGSFQCSDEVANCALKQTMHYGFITIPFMALTAFLLITLVLVMQKTTKS